MPKVHVVKQGECLSSIAHVYGFGSYRAIYEHPDNVAFRSKRADPAVILPGDRLVIPERAPKELTLQTGRVHRIQVRLPRTSLRLHLKDADGNAIADAPYTLEMEGQHIEGRTSREGLVDASVPASAAEALLAVTSLGLRLRLRLGALDPADTVSGAQARLNNLGFGAGPVDGELGAGTRRALRLFQEEQGLEASGALDDTTRDALVRAHGA
jgi:N-acetylmuramoyl-L-alanine amidase